MRSLLVTIGVFLTASSAFAFKPAVERDFDEVASRGCSNRDGDFIVRAMVSNANEDTVVLSDPLDSRSTISATLPGRGPLARVKGAFTKGKYEATAERLNELRADRSPVLVTLECKRDGAPVVRNIGFRNSDGTQASIAF
jgi:hypothetical protein